MTTGHTPNPPNHLTTQATDRDVHGQEVAPDVQPGGTEQPLSLGGDMARIIEGQIDIITQRLVYHSQMMFGVGGMGSDPVTARNTTLIVADALRNQRQEDVEHALVNLADPMLVQINDRTTPYKVNAQVEGILEGILVDTISKAYQDDPARVREARVMLESLFQVANEQMQAQSKAMIAFQAPGPHPNARR